MTLQVEVLGNWFLLLTVPDVKCVASDEVVVATKAQASLRIFS